MSETNAHLELRYVDGSPIRVLVSGHFDRSSSSDLTALVRHALFQRHDEVIVDLADVTFAGSELIGALVELAADSTGTGTRLSIRNIPNHLRSLSEAAGLQESGPRSRLTR